MSDIRQPTGMNVLLAIAVALAIVGLALLIIDPEPRDAEVKCLACEVRP